MKKNYSQIDYLFWLKSHIDSYYSVFYEQLEDGIESAIVEVFHYMVKDIVDRPDVTKAILEQFPGKSEKKKIINAVTFLLERFAKRFNSESAEDLLAHTIKEAKSSYTIARMSWEADSNSFLSSMILSKRFEVNLN